MVCVLSRFGLKSSRLIQDGEFVIEYVGEVIDDAECRRRMEEQTKVCTWVDLVWFFF